MRLLKRDSAGRISLTEDLPDAQRPKYAILSHTWSADGSRDEVSLDDIMTGAGPEKPGHEKIRFCAQQANRDGLDHFWVDTCCIDKTSSAELTKSLISMFRWYAEAERCYVYLSDVTQSPATSAGNEDNRWEDEFRDSRWFRRGWTLQELVAPSVIVFFSRDGRCLGTKHSLEGHINQITRIPLLALRGEQLSNFTKQERLQWQEGRETREPEDLVYSLFGIFGVSLSVLYGEGRARARDRLLAEIETVRKGIRHTDFSVPFSLGEVMETQHFVAREAELREVHDELRSDGERQTVVLHGLGGIGKTQLAIAYALRHVEDYSAIFWLNAQDTDTIKSSFAQVAKQILRTHPSAARLAGLDLQADLDKTVDAVKAWLSMPMNTRWLMMYDNYDNPATPGISHPAALDLRSYLPEAYQGSVLITTRSSQVRFGHSVHITKLEDFHDGLQILQSSSGRGDLSADPYAARLARKLDGLPLALTTAGAYLSQNAVSFVEYLEFFDQSWAELQRLAPILSTYEDRTLYSTWQVSFEQVERRSPLSANLLRWWAYFGNLDLWFELLDHSVDEEREWMQELTKDKLGFHATLQVICQHGLAETAPDLGSEAGSRGYRVHACVHSWMLAVLNARRDEVLAISALQRVASHAPDKDCVHSPLIQRRLLDHANRCLLQINEDYNNKRDLYWTHHTLGFLYAEQGKLAEAEMMYERALRRKERELGPDHMSTLDTINNLGLVYSAQGRIAEAEEMFLHALRGNEKAWGPEHTSTLDTVNNLGILYGDTEKLPEAEKMYLRALRGKEKEWGPDHTSTLDTVNNLGTLFADQGRLAEAEEMYLRALRGKEKAWGPDHTSTLDTVNNLGILYTQQGRPAEAEEMYQRALRGFEKAWGSDHTSTLNTVDNLAALLYTQGKLAEAERMFLRALRGKEKVWGPHHSSTLRTVNNLGFLYASKFPGKLAKAEELYLRALRGYEIIWGSDHTSTLEIASNLGQLYSDRGEVAEAEEMYQRAFARYDDMPPHVQVELDRLGKEISRAQAKSPIFAVNNEGPPSKQGSSGLGLRKLARLFKH